MSATGVREHATRVQTSNLVSRIVSTVRDDTFSKDNLVRMGSHQSSKHIINERKHDAA
jgi:hypothetical protein